MAKRHAVRVQNDGLKPGEDFVRGTKLGQVLEHLQQGTLSQVLGKILIAAEAASLAQHETGDAGKEDFEGSAVPHPGFDNDATPAEANGGTA